jgi:hypothetical protein
MTIKGRNLSLRGATATKQSGPTSEFGFMDGDPISKIYFSQIFPFIGNGRLLSELNNARIVFQVNVWERRSNNVPLRRGGKTPLRGIAEKPRLK